MITATRGYSNGLQANQRVNGASPTDAAASFRSALLAGSANSAAGTSLSAEPAGATRLPPSLPAEVLQADAGSTAPSTTASAADSRIADFRAWKADYVKHGIGDDRRQAVEDSSAAFEAVLTKAASGGGFDDPKAFLQSLSPSELSAVQTIHCLANPIDPAGLSQEGASNLLVSPDQVQDTDNDGFEQVGAAKTWHFPPPNAPASVKKAWKDATANAGDGDIMLLSGSFLPMTLGDSAYISPDADYAAMVQKTIDGAKFSSRYDESWQHETRSKQLTLLQSFLDRLQAA